MYAARVAAGRPEHDRQALDLALRALSTTPSVEALELIGEVMERLVAFDADDVVIFELRLQRARKAIATEARGSCWGTHRPCCCLGSPRGCWGSAVAAMEWTAAALACSGDVDEFDKMLPYVSVLVEHERGCVLFIDEVLGRGAGLRGTTGPSLFRFARALAQALEDGVRDAKLAEAQQTTQPKEGPVDVDPFADLADELSADSDQPPPPQQEEEEQASPDTQRGIPAPSVSRFSKTLPPGSNARAHCS